MNMDTLKRLNEKYHLAMIALGLHLTNSIIHIILTNISDSAYNFTKVLLMPLLCLFFLLSVKDLKKGWFIAWCLCGLWLGNICLIWGGSSKILFSLGSAFTVIGLFGYVWVLLREQKTVKSAVIFLQIPIMWLCAFFVVFMQDYLGKMLLPITLYMTLIFVISALALAQLLQNVRSKGAWLMFLGTLFYIGENGFYTAHHYMPNFPIGVNVIHFCFIMAQTLIVCGYLLREKEATH